MRLYREGHVWVRPRGGESYVQLMSRAKRFLLKMDRQYKGKTVVLYGHRDFILALKLLLRTPEAESACREVIHWRNISVQRGPPQYFPLWRQRRIKDDERAHFYRAQSENFLVRQCQQLHVPIRGDTRIVLHITPDLGSSKTYLVSNRAADLGSMSLTMIPVELNDRSTFSLNDLLCWIRYNPRIVGANVSYPFKGIAAEKVDDVSGLDRHMGVTAVYKNERMELTGCDGMGYAWVRWYEHYYGFGSLASRRIVILGAGPVGLSIAFQALKAGAARVVCTELQVKDNYRLNNFKRILPPAWRERFGFIQTDKSLLLRNELKSTDILINATGVGKDPEGVSPIPAGMLHPSLRVIDLNYRPVKIPILEFAQANCAESVNGWGYFLFANAENLRCYQKAIQNLGDANILFKLFIEATQSFQETLPSRSSANTLFVLNNLMTMLPSDADPALVRRLDRLLVRFKEVLTRSAYYHETFNLAEFYRPEKQDIPCRWDERRGEYYETVSGQQLPIINQIEHVEQCLGIKSPEDRFTIPVENPSGQIQSCQIHPYRSNISGRKAGEVVAKAIENITDKVRGLLTIQNESPVLIVINGRPGSGKTHFSRLLQSSGCFKGVLSESIVVVHVDKLLSSENGQLRIDRSKAVDFWKDACRDKKRVVILEGINSQQVIDSKEFQQELANSAVRIIRVFVKTRDNPALWERLRRDPGERWASFYHLASRSLVRNIRMRYLGTDLEELNADVVVDNNMIFQAPSSYTVLSPADPRMKEKDLVGLKAVGLAILNSLKGINVPRFTVITTKAYLGFLQSRPDISYMITRL